MKLVCIDTHLLIWGIREVAEDGQENMIQRTKDFFNDCVENDVKILVPSVVVGELLTAIEPKHHAMTLNLLQSGFILSPYDAKASALFAQMWREKKESGFVKEIQNELQATRQELKADCMIVATAVSNKAEVIYSHDGKLKKFANGNILVEEVPNIPKQTEIDLSNTSD